MPREFVNVDNAGNPILSLRADAPARVKIRRKLGETDENTLQLNSPPFMRHNAISVFRSRVAAGLPDEKGGTKAPLFT